MTNFEFKPFRKAVESAGKDSDVWYDGCSWIDLTPRQAEIIRKILAGKNFLKDTKNIRGQNAWELPSGLTFVK